MFLQLDRFIPNRSAIDLDTASFNLAKENGTDDASRGGSSSVSPGREEYQRLLASSLNVDGASRILAFKQKAPAPPVSHDNDLKSLYNQNLAPAPSKKTFRHVPSSQERILDAPELVDDYYLNLLDWSCQNMVGGCDGCTITCHGALLCASCPQGQKGTGPRPCAAPPLLSVKKHGKSTQYTSACSMVRMSWHTADEDKADSERLSLQGSDPHKPNPPKPGHKQPPLYF